MFVEIFDNEIFIFDNYIAAAANFKSKVKFTILRCVNCHIIDNDTVRENITANVCKLGFSFDQMTALLMYDQIIYVLL